MEHIDLIHTMKRSQTSLTLISKESTMQFKNSGNTLVTSGWDHYKSEEDTNALHEFHGWRNMKRPRISYHSIGRTTTTLRTTNIYYQDGRGKEERDG